MFNSRLIEGLKNYPLLEPVQNFIDSRGSIVNLADGEIGDVAVITSEAGAVRANHFHDEDWHICHLTQGKFIYYWRELSDLTTKKIVISPGISVVTPPLIAHRFEFIEKSTLIVISKLSRIKSNYDFDTHQLDPSTFD
jgi:dTDP-4-dehydrorhamnose 3,5-epimerase-like enzyme